MRGKTGLKEVVVGGSYVKHLVKKGETLVCFKLALLMMVLLGRLLTVSKLSLGGFQVKLSMLPVCPPTFAHSKRHIWRSTLNNGYYRPLSKRSTE